MTTLLLFCYVYTFNMAIFINLHKYCISFGDDNDLQHICYHIGAIQLLVQQPKKKKKEKSAYNSH